MEWIIKQSNTNTTHPSVRQNNIDKLYEVVSYCENNFDCRRQLMLSYFDEEFDPINCHLTCDNCKYMDTHSEFEIQKQNISEIGRSIAQFVVYYNRTGQLKRNFLIEI